MIFTDRPFLVFAVVFFPLYFATRGMARMWLVLVASFVFYGWWDWRWCGLLFFTILVDYWAARCIVDTNDEHQRKLYLTASVVANLGVLGVFKYYDFFILSVAAGLERLGVHASLSVLGLILPIGVSFYTFQSMSYTIDVYRRRVPAETNFVTFASCVAIFPHLVAGPIIRASRLIPQVKMHHEWSWPRVARGLEFVMWGFFLKLVMADNLAFVVDSRFGHYNDFGSLHLAFGVVAFAFQIYGDFAGYSLIAIGLGRIMGLNFGRNFNRPYFAADFREFWQRWHISLSTWLRDYLYVPLGGNRGSALFTARNLMLTMLLGGLWHGANWTFVIWGALHGASLVAQRTLPTKFYSGIPRILRAVFVFSMVCLAWVFFRSPSLSEAVHFLKQLGRASSLLARPADDRISLLLPILSICAVLVIDRLSVDLRLRKAYLRSPSMRALGAVVLIWIIILFGRFDGQAFIYFQF